MALVDPYSLTIGQTVSFNSVHPNDNVLYNGIIDGIVKYSIAKGYDDLLPYYRIVKKTLTSMAPIDELTYMILIQSQEDLKKCVVMALEWIEPSSLKIIEKTNSFDIRIYERPRSEANTIIKLLNDHEYKCALV